MLREKSATGARNGLTSKQQQRIQVQLSPLVAAWCDRVPMGYSPICAGQLRIRQKTARAGSFWRDPRSQYLGHPLP